MRFLPRSLNERDQATLDFTFVFLDGRLEERETINWALDLGSDDIVQRWAVLHLIDRKKGVNLREPWRSAWRLIEEFWENSIDDQSLMMGAYQVKERLCSGERSKALVSAIMDLVAPRLKIEVYPRVYLQFRKFPKRPKTFHDLFRVTMTSGKTIDPAFLDLEKLTEVEFMVSLANALDAAVMGGLDIARRIGQRHVHLSLRRVYFESDSKGDEVPDELEMFSTGGMAPSVKLLHAVVSRLVDVDCSTALAHIRRWKKPDSPIHLRLWAAVSCDFQVMPATEVGDFLLHLDSEVFWDLHHHPEVVELRARRFAEFDEITKKEITRRIRGRPPRKLWPRNAEADRVKNCRLKWAVRELRRIEVAGATLPQRDKTWLESNIVRFPELAEMDRIDEGFLGPTKVERVPTSPDRSMDSLAGIDLLRALEMKIPADQAWDWFREAGKLERILQGMESSPDGGSEFPKVWECFSVTHSPPAGREQETNNIDLSAEASRVLDLLTKLPDETIFKAIKGISYWLSIWKKYVLTLPRWSKFWLRAWSLAVQKTNAMQLPDEEPEQILNTPAAVIIDVFLAALPNLEEKSRPIDKSGNLEKMRKKIINASGRSRLIAKYRMIEALSYSLNADQEWTEKHLIEPLRAKDTEALALWRVVSRQTQCTDILRIIGNDMADRTADHRLDRTTRSSLASSLLVETLHALQQKRDPAVGRNRVQQMIRSLDDEVRANCGEVITRFLREQSEQSDQRPNPPFSEELFQSAAKPFLQKVWPQEHSLVSPAVSSGLAALPIAARGDFAEAVATIERFLIPFDCWSMLEYGLYREDKEKPNLSMIDDEAKAQGLLNLLDLTVGTAENAVIPLDLGDALEQVRKVAPHLAKTPKYRRLETAARRV